MTIKHILATSVTTASLVLSSFLSTAAYADTTAVVGNGAFSTSRADVNASSNTTVAQNNTAQVDNTVTTNADTGHNSANNLTGGSAAILTGDASSAVNIQNMLNQNLANVTGANAGNGSQTLLQGNGAGSDNNANTNASANTQVFQTNLADVNNHVKTNENTGYNSADNLTWGNAVIRSGNASAWTNLGTQANSNTANVMGGNQGYGGQAAVVAGNGAWSQNDLQTNNQNTMTTVQNNNAYVSNSVQGKLDTGYNSADNGTFGNASIYTGNAQADTNVWNRLNANYATVTSAGNSGSLDKILGNGYGSNNTLTDTSSRNVSAFGTNYADLSNQVSPKLKTGYNALNNETGSLFGYVDPAVRTGTAHSYSNVVNEANSNQVAQMSFGGTNYSFDFNPLGLLGGFLGY